MFSRAAFNLQVIGHGTGTWEIRNKGTVAVEALLVFTSQKAGEWKAQSFDLSAMKFKRHSAFSPLGMGHHVVPQQLLTETELFLKVTRAHLTAEVVSLHNPGPAAFEHSDWKSLKQI